MTDVVVRPYRPGDHAAARALWVELAERRSGLYGRSAGADPGAGFEDYLTRLDLSGIWVADDPNEGVIGLVGLLMQGTSGEVEPIVVAARRRGSGIGAALLKHVTGEAKKRSLARLTIRPESRNVEAMKSLHAAGFDLLSAVELSLDLHPAPSTVDDIEIQLHGLRFRG
ncbi:GNAT family N-acetyltransferase [Asanoa iriomotensis]|nr:GNAT family N-acetyltransferase [Asanoa iriomotensis]